MVVEITYKGRSWGDELLANDVKNCLILNAEVDMLLVKVLTARCYMKLKKLKHGWLNLMSQEVSNNYE